jgi:hypothetical protein
MIYNSSVTRPVEKQLPKSPASIAPPPVPILDMAHPQLGRKPRWGAFKWVLFSIALALVLALILAVFAGHLIVNPFQRAIAQLDAVVLSPANYQPVEMDLVRLCQSDPSLVQNESQADPFDPAWAPPSLSKLHPEDIQIDSGHATVTFGGGFYHDGWDLVRQSGDDNATTRTWTLSFYSEDNPSKVLATFTAPTNLRYSEAQFAIQTNNEYDRRLATRWDDGISTDAAWYTATARCIFLAKHHQIDLLRKSILKAGANYPHDWRDVLLAYLINQHAADPNAASQLRSWARQTRGQTAGVYAAYAFYQSGDASAGDDALNKASAMTTSDPDWIDKDVPECEMGMAVRLYSTGEFASCGKLCNAILTLPHRYFQTRPAVTRLRGWASSTATSRPAELPQYDKYTVMDPFGGFDLSSLLQSAAATSSAP